jgi:hypothetical protein
MSADEFWRWFATAADPLGGLVRQRAASGEVLPDLAHAVDELNRHTMAFHPLVHAQVGGSADRPELILTPEGDPDGAEHVRRLAAAAPALPGWTVRAFKPRMEMSDTACHFRSVTVTPDDIEFVLIDVTRPDHAPVGLLVLFVRDLAGPHAEEVQFAAERLIEAVFGEALALYSNEFTVWYDREATVEKVRNLPRSSLRKIEGLLDRLDHLLGPHAPQQ